MIKLDADDDLDMAASVSAYYRTKLGRMQQAPRHGLELKPRSGRYLPQFVVVPL